VSFLCLDPGTKRIGVAVAEPPAYIAVPLETLAAEPVDALMASLRRIAQERAVKQLVVGLPLETSGREGASAQAARGLGQAVADELALPVDYQDERMTSNEAGHAVSPHSRRENKGLVDAVAAALILESYLHRVGKVK
jgi:putative Holliday junction resolvase